MKNIAPEGSNEPSIETLQAEITALRRELADLRTEKVQLEERLERLAEHVASLEAEIKMASSNVAGEPGSRNVERQERRKTENDRDERKTIEGSPSTLPAVLDPTALKNLREMIGDESDFMVEMIDTFLADAPRLLATMRQAIESEAAASLQLAAHTLKSNSADFGATTLSTLCKALEAKGREEVLEGAAALLAQAETEYETVKGALMRMREWELN